jgi:hypothetical protein
MFVKNEGGAQSREGIQTLYDIRSGLTIKMWEWLNKTLFKFRECFSRQAAFEWFVVIVVGLMIRSDHLGVTSIVRELSIAPNLYENMIHFFHAGSWCADKISAMWLDIVKNSGVLFRVNGRNVIIVDGTKLPKEGEKMPAVKKLHQESEDSSKPMYIFGHMYGATGVLIGTEKKQFCVPVMATLQDGAHTIRAWHDDKYQPVSHVVQMMRDGCKVAAAIGKSILLMDRYFLTAPALKAILACQKQYGDEDLVTIVTRAKSNAVAYEEPVQKGGRGAPRKKGKKVHLKDFFIDLSIFTEATVISNGKKKTIKYYCKDLLWGEGLYIKLRFVMVKFGEIYSIFVCSDLTISAEDILKLYGFRFKIEIMFRTFKQVIAGFSYHFWSSYMPQLNRYLKKDDPNPIDLVEDAKAKAHILSAFKAIEGYVALSCVAVGLLQLLAVLFAKSVDFAAYRWLRTKAVGIVSEATVASFMRKTIFSVFQFSPDLPIVGIITRKQSDPADLGGCRSA